MRYLLALGLLSVLHDTAFAQPEAAAEREAPEQRQALAREDNQSADADVRTGFVGSGVLVSASSDTSNISLTLSHSWDGGGASNLNFTSLSAVLTAPISDKERKEGAFVTEGGLPDSYSIQASLTHTLMPLEPLPSTAERRRELFMRARERCRIAARTQASATACDSATMRDTDEHLSREERREIWGQLPVFLLGLSGSIGTREFDFRGLTDFAEDSVNRTEYSVSGFFGWSPGSSPYYLGAGYEIRRQYKSVTARTLCPTSVPPAVQECFTASFGEPTRNIDSNIFAVARWQGDLRIGSRSLPMGIELRAAYDTRDNVLGLALPIYFISGSDGLRGGVRFNWQDVEDSDERFGFRVFIGTPFRLLGS